MCLPMHLITFDIQVFFLHYACNTVIKLLKEILKSVFITLESFSKKKECKTHYWPIKFLLEKK